MSSTAGMTAQRIVERSLRSWPQRVAVVDGEREATFGALDDRSARLANVLLGSGGGPLRPAATYLPNMLEFVEVDLACCRSGVTRLGISDRLTADECAYILADAQAAVLITTPAFFEALGDLLPDTVELVLIVGDHRPANGSVACRRYEDALADASSALSVGVLAAGAPNYILYTSGTTGRPKGATHTHAGRAAAMVNMIAAELPLDGAPVMVHAGPLTHGSGSKLLAFFAAGARNVILPRFTAESLAQTIVAEGGTHTFLVPTMLQRLLEAGPEVVQAVASLRQVSFGGSPISPTLFRRAIDGFGPNLTQVYGSCEAPHPITLLRGSDYGDAGASDRILQSAGRAAYGVDIKVVDDDGNVVQDGEAGELLVRSAHLMSGYWRNEAATSEVFTEDGWYCAGDLATLDSDGLVSFHDRKRDLIISGGLNVYPSEVERVIAEHPGVRDVAVIGAPDDEWGEAVVAYVVPMTDGVTSEEIIAWTRTRLASYKKPQRVEFLERLPLGSSNKVLKSELRDTLWQGQDRRVN